MKITPAIEQKFRKLKEVQSKVQNNLNKLEDTYSTLINPNSDLEKKKIRRDVEELFNERNEALIYSETNMNYHNLFETFLSTLKNRKISPVKQEKPIPKKVVSKKKVEKQKILQKVEPVLVVEPSKKVESIVSKIEEEKEELNLVKKEKEILKNEIENMREKLEEINFKSQEIKQKIEKPLIIQNYKLLDKLIDGFTEALTVHWEDVLDAFIDDLLIEEVKVLNKIEREKKNTMKTFEEYATYVSESSKHSDYIYKQPYNINNFKEVLSELDLKEKSIKIKHNFA